MTGPQPGDVLFSTDDVDDSGAVEVAAVEDGLFIVTAGDEDERGNAVLTPPQLARLAAALNVALAGDGGQS